MSDLEEPVRLLDKPKVRQRKLTLNERESMYHVVKSCIVNGAIPHGKRKLIAEQFSVCPNTVVNVWKQGCASLINSKTGVVDVAPKKALSGNKPKYDRETLKQQIKLISLKKRKTIRDTAECLSMSKTTFHRLCRVNKIFKPCTITIRPKLTKKHKTNRLAFVQREINGKYYKDQCNRIHIDEK